MSDKMKVRDGNDGYSYPYTSPDLVIDENGKSVKKRIDEVESKIKENGGATIDDVNTSTDKTWSSSKIDSQFKNIAKKTIIENNKLYLVKSDGTKLDDGTELSIDLTNYVTKNDLKNVVTYNPEDGDTDYINADNIAFSNENFTATNVKGAITELFQSASNGKILIANAITGKGVVTNANDSFQTMATNISNIVVNNSNVIESGSFTPEDGLSSYTITTNNPCTNFILVCTQTSNPNSYRFTYSIVITSICNLFIGSNVSGNSVSAIKVDSTNCTFANNIISINVGDSKLMTCEYKWLAW